MATMTLKYLEMMEAGIISVDEAIRLIKGRKRIAVRKRSDRPKPRLELPREPILQDNNYNFLSPFQG